MGEDTLRTFTGGFVDELARSGVRHAVVCPGSRSTPLALLLRQHPGIRVWMHLDERSAAFFALGMAKAGREPVAVVSTSGTAAVNFAPAVVEAYYSRVPLLVLTADRPSELRGVGSPQTIDQVQLYGRHAKWFVEATLPESSPEATRYARTLACRATAAARAVPAGPVHVNLPFREPLIPRGEGAAPGGRAADAGDGTAPPFVRVVEGRPRLDPGDLAPLVAVLSGDVRALIVCGPQSRPDFPSAVMRLARELDVPVLADPLSQVRCGPHYDGRVIDSYDAFLRDESLASALRPDVVLRFGAAPVSKPLQQYLARHASARQVSVDDGQGWADPAAVAGGVFHVDPVAFCEVLAETVRAARRRCLADSGRSWCSRWRELNALTRATLTGELEEASSLSEPRVFVELARLLPPGATLFTGNSMPVRDLDTFFPGSDRPLVCLANRGASGIDGVVSAALGAGVTGGRPLVLVVGDLSFYHDMNGLLAAKLHGLSATIVLLNNDGGGIFSFLPQADLPNHFEELFGTPHGLDFRPVAEMYGLEYRMADSWDAFRSAVGGGLRSEGVTLVEVRTERRANAELHRRLWSATAVAVAGVAGAKG